MIVINCRRINNTLLYIADSIIYVAYITVSVLLLSIEYVITVNIPKEDESVTAA